MSGNQTLAETSQVDLRIVEETTYGETPGTARALEMRFVSSSLQAQKETAASDEINETRDVEELIRVSDMVEGATPGELSLDASWCKLLELGLSCDVGDGSFKTVGKPVKVQVVAGSTKIVRDTGSWVEDGFVSGQNVRTRGFSNAGNNGVFPVSGVTGTDLTLGTGTGTLADEASTLGPEVVGIPGQVVVGASVAATSSGNKFTRASGSFVTAGFKAGGYLRALGFATSGNNKRHKIVSVSALEIVVASTLATDSASSAVALIGCEFANGVTHKSATIEQVHSDVGTFHALKGCRVGSMEFGFTAKEKVTVDVSWMGAKEVDDTSTVMTSISSRSAVCKPVAASLSVGVVEIDGSTTTELIRELTIQIENNLEAQFVIGSANPANITYGDFTLTGSIVFLYKDLTQYQKFKNHDDMAVSVTIIDDNGDALIFDIPRLKFSGMTREVGGKNQPVLLSGEYQALLDSSSGKTLRIHRIPA